MQKQLPLTLAAGSDVDRAAPRAEESLDRGIYEVRIQRATVKERRYLRAMAELGPGPYKVGAIEIEIPAQKRLSPGPGLASATFVPNPYWADSTPPPPSPNKEPSICWVL